MTRDELEKHLDEKVKIILFDGKVLTGYLRKTGDERFKNNNNLYVPKNYYFLTPTSESKECVCHLIFRVSHITKLKRAKL